MSDSEAESAFNQNMMAGGMLAQGPVEFGEKYKRKWLVTDYEAGDVVFHNSYSVGDKNLSQNDPH
jgi:phytanoyl-CoA hydroxylase